MTISLQDDSRAELDLNLFPYHASPPDLTSLTAEAICGESFRLSDNPLQLDGQSLIVGGEWHESDGRARTLLIVQIPNQPLPHHRSSTAARSPAHLNRRPFTGTSQSPPIHQ